MTKHFSSGVNSFWSDSVKLICAVVFVFLLFLSAIPVRAQESGTILGTVKDPSGGVVPEAKVTILNTETGDARTVVTASDGSFRVPALQVGNYTLKVEKEGFKTQSTTGLALSVTQELVVNASLEVGTSSQEVTVTSEQLLQVETTNSTLGALVGEQSVAELPLNGRNWIDLTLMQPGITKGTAGGGNNTGTAFSSNGAPVRGNNVMLDGAIMQNIYGVNSSSITGTTLGVDGIREYKLVTSMFGAEYGMSMGSQTAIVSKGGTNQFHGSAFEYFRNSVLDARNFFELPPSSVQLGGRRLPEFQRNQFGGSFGGPIQKDKMFFHVVFEDLQSRTGLTPALNFVPAAGCHAPAGTVLTNAICPDLNLPASVPSITVWQFTPTLINLIPLPNAPGGQYAPSYTQPTSEQFGQVRLDRAFSASDTGFVRYTIDNTLTRPLIAYGPVTTSGSQWNSLQTSRSQFLTLGENHVFTAALLNSARLSYSRTYPITIVTDNSGASLVGGGIKDIGMGIVSIGSTGFKTYQGYGPPTAYPVSNAQNIFTLSDDLFWTKGRHALKFGTLLNHYADLTYDGHYIGGNMSFGSLALFEAGYPSSYAQMSRPGSTCLTCTFGPIGVANPRTNWRYNTYGFYVQDDIRLLSRLTLNAGLRYEFNGVPREVTGQEFSVRDVTKDTAPTHGPVMDNTSLRNFSPRVGFAWDTLGNGKMAIRGGFGLYYDISNFGNLMFQEALGTPPGSAVNNAVIVPCVLPGTTGSTLPACTTQFTIPYTFPPGSQGNTLQTIGYHNPQPKIYEYSLSVERQLPANTLLSVAYISTHGVNLWRVTAENGYFPTNFVNGQPFWRTCQNQLNVNVCRVNPVWGSATYATSANYFGKGSSESWYNGLQVLLTKRMSHGLQFQTSYTYAKTLDTTQGQMAGGDLTTDTVYPFDRSFDKGPTQFSQTHNFQVSMVYHLPRMKSDSFVSKLANGWWMGSIASITSGFPLTPILNYNANGDLLAGQGQSVTDRVDFVTSANLAYAQSLNKNAVVYNPDTVIVGTPTKWYDFNMFVPAPLTSTPTLDVPTTPCTYKYDTTNGQLTTPPCYGRLGNIPRGLITGPGQVNWNFSVSKDTAIRAFGERGNLQFRAEAFNILNHANFAQPSTTAWTITGLSTAAQIKTTATTARQFQLSLRLEF